MEPSLLQYELQFSHSFLTGKLPYPYDCICGSPIDPLQQVDVFPVLKTPQLETVLHLGGLTKAEQRSRIISLGLFATFLLLEARISLALWTASTYIPGLCPGFHWTVPEFFSTGLLSILSCFDLQNFMRFTWAPTLRDHYPGHSRGCLNPQQCQPHHSTWFWVRTQSPCLGH